MLRFGTHLSVVVFTALASMAAAARAQEQQARPSISPDNAVAAYCAAWNTVDRIKRERLLEKAWARDGVYSDPDTAPVVGRAALSDTIAAFQKGHPGVLFRCSAPQLHHGAMRVTWLALRSDKSEAWHGTDFQELAADGRIRQVTGFFGGPPVVKP